jgi:peptide/nickel transport system substrate-binding protein
MRYRNTTNPWRCKSARFSAKNFNMGKRKTLGRLYVSCLFLASCIALSPSRLAARPFQHPSLPADVPGVRGGTLTIALRSEPKTLNPVLATDASAQDVIYCLNADLIHIDRESQRTQPALAESWNVSRDGRTYTLHLRRGVRFSDGQPFTADDVVFSFRLYLDAKIDSPQRDLLVIGGKPISVEKVDDYTVRFQLAAPYAAAERLFDGFPILPRHLLESSYRGGNFSQEWSISSPPADFAGLGPFRLKEYVPGQRIVLERNPYYWKRDSAGTQLPYLDKVVFLFVPSEDAQVIRFLSGDTDILSRFSSENYSVLARQEAARKFHVYDLGPSLEYNFLFFNLNDLSAKHLPQIAQKQSWFREVRFRQAVSAAIDRDAIVRLVYQGRATALASQVTPGNKLWLDPAVPAPVHSPQRARQLLKSAGFSWHSDGSLVDPHGTRVEFSILTSSSNAQRLKIATLIQSDLGQVGMNVHIVSLDFGAMVDRLLNTFDYEAAIMGLADGDADPNTEMNVWLSSGGMHLWHLNEPHPATPWEADLDRLMKEQLVTLNYAKRKQLYDQVQQIVARQAPIICLASPNILAGAKDRVGNFSPAILAPYVLWNVDRIYVR